MLLLARYVNFFKSLLSNDSFEVRFLAHISVADMKTVLGRTIATIANMTGVEDPLSLSANLVKAKLNYSEMPKDEEWRPGLIKDMMYAVNKESDGLSKDEMLDLIEFVCTM